MRHPRWVRPSGRRLGVYGALSVLLVMALHLAFRFKSISGQDIIVFSIYSSQQMDSLRAALSDEGSLGALGERLSYSYIWHVGSTDQGSGFKHIFYFAGKKRSMTRVEGLAVTTVLDGSIYRVSKVEEEFAHQDLGNPPEIRDVRGLEVLKAALEDEGVRSKILLSLQDQKLQFHRIEVLTIHPDSKFKLSVSAPVPDHQTVELKWDVLKESAGSPYVFLND